MLNVLYKYLVLNGNVGIPGVGNFSTHRSGAQFKESSFYPPLHDISFVGGTALTDKNFYHFLALEKGISDVDAVRQFQDFSYQLRKDLQSHSFIELSGIGVLKRNTTGEIILDSTIATHKYFPILTPELITANEDASIDPSLEEQELYTEQEQIINKDRWWIWATVLAVLAIAVIAYFYWQESLR